ncbi:integration host factor subunit alpha [Thermodesulfobacteriota bacterium]
MTLTKKDLVKNIMENVHLKRKNKTRQQFLFPEFNFTPLSKKMANNLVESTFEIMKQTLVQGDHILVSGFGKFHVKFKWARKGRNPQTGKPIILKSRRAVTFQSSPKLKKNVNRDQDAPLSEP